MRKEPQKRSATRGNKPPAAPTSRRSASPEQNPSLSAASRFADAKKNYERYLALAGASATTGDRVQTENYYQHAEHYFRLMRQQPAA